MGIQVVGSLGSNAQAVTGNKISGNQIANNIGWGLRLNATQTGNHIFGNNIISNNPSVGFQVSIPQAMVVNDIKSNVAINMVPGMANDWNSNNQGNFWSDFKTRYPDAHQKSGIWETPFYINENNIDKYPLANPLPTPTLTIEQKINSETTLPTSPPGLTHPTFSFPPQPTQTSNPTTPTSTPTPKSSPIVYIELTAALLAAAFSSLLVYWRVICQKKKSNVNQEI